MQDILKKYKKKKFHSNITIILTSLVLAIWINFLLVDGTNLWQNLKASVLNSEIQNNKSDLSIENINNNLYLIANKNINQIETLSFSLSYNPQNIEINSIDSEYWDIVNLSNTPGINSIILTSDNLINIKKWDKLTLIKVSKIKNVAENLNIINANFKDNWLDRYELSTSWITF